MNLKGIGINTRNWVDSTHDKGFLQSLCECVIEPPGFICNGFTYCWMKNKRWRFCSTISPCPMNKFLLKPLYMAVTLPSRHSGGLDIYINYLSKFSTRLTKFHSPILKSDVKITEMPCLSKSNALFPSSDKTDNNCIRYMKLMQGMAELKVPSFIKWVKGWRKFDYVVVCDIDKSLEINLHYYSLQFCWREGKFRI